MLSWFFGDTSSNSNENSSSVVTVSSEGITSPGSKPKDLVKEESMVVPSAISGNGNPSMALAATQQQQQQQQQSQQQQSQQTQDTTKPTIAATTASDSSVIHLSQHNAPNGGHPTSNGYLMDSLQNASSTSSKMDMNMNKVPDSGEKEVAIADTHMSLRQEVIMSLSVCLFYIIVSSSMVFTNKALSYSYGFTTTNSLLFMQMIFTIILLSFLRNVLKVLHFPAFDPQVAKRVAPVSVFYCFNAVTALLAVRELSVPSYTLIKRLAPLFSLVLEWFILKKRAHLRVWASLMVMLLGTIVAAHADTMGTALGWVMGLTSCLFQAAYLAYVKKSGVETGLNSFGVLYYHSILSLPILTVLVLVTGEIPVLWTYPYWVDWGFLVVLAFSLFMGVMLNYALFLATEKTSPTSTMVSGHVKSIAQTAIGMFTFGGSDSSASYLVGTCMNITGGMGYGYSKYVDMKERQREIKG